MNDWKYCHGCIQQFTAALLFLTGSVFRPWKGSKIGSFHFGVIGWHGVSRIRLSLSLQNWGFASRFRFVHTCFLSQRCFWLTLLCWFEVGADYSIKPNTHQKLTENGTWKGSNLSFLTKAHLWIKKCTSQKDVLINPKTMLGFCWSCTWYHQTLKLFPPGHLVVFDAHQMGVVSVDDQCAAQPIGKNPG